MPLQFTAALSGPLSVSQDDQDIIRASVPVILQGLLSPWPPESPGMRCRWQGAATVTLPLTPEGDHQIVT